MDNKTVDELDELEDEEDERVLAQYRLKRIAEMRALQEKNKFGSVIEITAVDYTKEVNQAGEGIWVVLHLYKPGYVLTLSKKNQIFNYYIGVILLF